MSVGRSFAVIAGRVLEPVEGMHGVIARRWFGVLGPVGGPLGRWHDAASSIVYGSIRLGSTLLGVAIDAGGRVAPSTDEATRAWIAGLLGDGPETMTVRGKGGEAVPLGPDLSKAFPDATGRIVVLVHGLGMTERSWAGTADRPGLAEAVAADPHLTAVSIRYHTGLGVSENGERLSALLEELHDSWPVAVESIALVGHSMGGLVIADAARRGDGRRWIRRLTDVVSVGAPHRGAPLERLVAATAWGLGLAQTTRPLAAFLGGRSRGVKDLGGAGPTPDEAPEPPPHRHHFIAGVVTSAPDNPLGAMLGDLMVPPGRARPHGTVDRIVVGGSNHFGLIRNPVVIEHVVCRLSPPDT